MVVEAWACHGVQVMASCAVLCRSTGDRRPLVCTQVPVRQVAQVTRAVFTGHFGACPSVTGYAAAQHTTTLKAPVALHESCVGRTVHLH